MYTISYKIKDGFNSEFSTNLSTSVTKEEVINEIVDTIKLFGASKISKIKFNRDDTLIYDFLPTNKSYSDVEIDKFSNEVALYIKSRGSV